MTKIYLAGPDVFLPDAVEIWRRKAELCTRHGLIGLYPLDNAIDPAASSAATTAQTTQSAIHQGYLVQPLWRTIFRRR